MADLKGRLDSVRQALCCFVAKDASPDPPQQPSCNAADNSDPESISDQPVQAPGPEVMSQIVNLPRWEDREAVYQKRIHDLREELTTALKNKKALSGHLYEMGRLAFPKMDPGDSTSPSFVEKLKVYLECLQLERHQLEKRVLRAEQTIWEMENEVCDLEKRLQDCGYRGTHRTERRFMPHGPPPLFPTQPVRFFFSKMHKKSPEQQAAAQSPGKWAEEGFGDVASQKKSPPVKEALAKISWRSPSKPRSTEAKSCVPQEKRDIFTGHRLPQTVSYSATGSCWPTAERPRCSRAIGYGDTCVAQVHGHWDAHPEGEQEDFAQGAEDDSLSTTSTLPVATPTRGGSQDIKISPDSSVNLDISPALQLSEAENCHVWSEMQHIATMEGNRETGRQGEGVTSKEEECVNSGSVSLQPVGLADQVFKNLSDAPANPEKLEDLEVKTFQDPPGHAALQTEISLPGGDSLKSGKSQGIRIVHSSNQRADVEPGTSQALSDEQASCNLDLLQKPGDFFSLELSLKADLPSSSIKSPEMNFPLGEKRVLDDASGLNNEVDQPIPMEESPPVASPPPGEPLLSGLNEALTSVSLESPQPTSLTEESPSSLAEETAVEEN